MRDKTEIKDGKVKEGNLKWELYQKIKEDGKFSHLKKSQQQMIARATYDVFFTAIERAVVNNMKITISGFGSFEPRIVKSKKHYDYTRKVMGMSRAYKTFKFTISKQLRDQLTDENNEFKKTNTRSN